jgi:polyisoprenoid-binding protein YceI
MSETTPSEVRTYTIDPAHSTVRFSIRHLMISKVHGSFGKISGTVTVDPSNVEGAQLDATIDVTSINTDNEGRDNHLKSPDFFDVEQFPTMTYKSTKGTKTGDLEGVVYGDLTLHGVTKEVPLTVEVSDEVPSPWGGFKVGVSATAKIDRRDFGLNFNHALASGGVMVGNDVAITIEVELDRPA